MPLSTERVQAYLSSVLGVAVDRYSASESMYPDAECELLAPMAEEHTFEVYVFASEDELCGLLNDDGSPLEEDAANDGVYWYRDDDPGGLYWIALSNYGDNVQLLWFSKRPELDKRWARVDRVLRDLVAFAR
jgi:hypothetical protein